MTKTRQTETIKINFLKAQTRISDISDLASGLYEELYFLARHDFKGRKPIEVKLSNLQAEKAMLATMLGYHQTESGRWTI